jgi:autotransporter-associated beta strand protein
MRTFFTEMRNTMPFASPTTSQKTFSRWIVFAGCVAAAVGGTCGRLAFAQTANWTGGTSTDYFTGGNWSTNAAPALSQNVDIQTPATFMPSYIGDNTGNQTGQFAVQPGATFTMTSGTFQTGHMYIANNNAAGIATFNMTSGSVRVNGDFRTSNVQPASGSGTNAAYNQSGGFLYVNSVNANQEAWFANLANNTNPQVVTTAVITGGSFMSNGRIRMGTSPSNFDTRRPSYLKMTMSGGVMAATNISNTSDDGRGTLNFNAGDITVTGGILRGTDLSSARGFDVMWTGNTAGTQPPVPNPTVPNAGLKMNGGVMQINTNLTEGSLYVVPQGADPLTVTGVPFNRGQNRMIGTTANSMGLNRGYRGFSELTTVGGTTTYTYPVRVWMTTGTNDAGQEKNQANGFASNPGDYNLDGKVNQADYNYAQTQMGNTYMDDPLAPTTSLVRYYGADGNGDGTVTQADLDVWNALYGQRTTGGVYAWATPVSIAVSSGQQTQTTAGYSNLSFTTASSVTKTGGGTLVLDQANSMTGTITIQGGSVQLSGSVNAAAAATIRPEAGGTLTLDPYLQASIDGLQPLAGGLTDVGTGRVTVAAGGLSTADMVSAIVLGRNGGGWNGATGITSSEAAASSGSRAVGWIENGDSVANMSSLTFAFAAPGDTNLDMQVDVTDAANFVTASKYDTGLQATWIEGDFNYDGVVDIQDAAEFTTTGLYDTGVYNPPSASGAVAAVPEPSSAGVVVGMAGLVLAWRLRRRAA